MKNKNIILRYIRESDIADYERWVTTETEWCDWDAPWEDDNPDEFLER
jgi:transcription initiation factor IIE alpha subunit